MTIPLSPASERRGPRETLLHLTESYLRRGELDAEERRCAATLAVRARRERTPAGGTPDWAALAVVLAATLRGETLRALQLVSAAERAGGVPPALMGPLFGLGVRAALAADRPVLAERWRARGAAPGAARKSGTSAPAGDELDDSVLATLPELVRALMAAPQGPAPADERLSAGGAGYRGAGEDADGEDGAPRATGRGGTAGPAAAAEGAGAVPQSAEEAPRAHLHVVMNAYHGDVVSLPAQVRVLADRDAGGPEADAGQRTRAAGTESTLAPDGAAAPAAGPWPDEVAPLLTVRVDAGEALPSPPVGDGWHVRFVGRLRALDARSSDGSLLDLTWDERGFVVTLVPPEWLGELGTSTAVLATRVTHVVVVPES